ncbi:MAG: HAD-IA family hydrolase [Anaerolineales bacterium]
MLLTNGWDQHARLLAAKNFNLDYGVLNQRHHLTYDTYEAGKISLDEYLRRIVFNQPRSFSKEEFVNFMFQYSQPYQEMLDLIHHIKAEHQLRTVAVSNEGRELTLYRIQKFKLHKIIDSFVSSCFVHLRKPDVAMYQLAMDISHTLPENALYLDDRLMFIEVAQGLGIHTIHHQNAGDTQTKLADFCLL